MNILRDKQPTSHRTAEQSHELAPSHSITSSARASTAVHTLSAECLGGLEVR